MYTCLQISKRYYHISSIKERKRFLFIQVLALTAVLFPVSRLYSAMRHLFFLSYCLLATRKVIQDIRQRVSIYCYRLHGSFFYTNRYNIYIFLPFLLVIGYPIVLQGTAGCEVKIYPQDKKQQILKYISILIYIVILQIRSININIYILFLFSLHP